jgi:hypothetical protein
MKPRPGSPHLATALRWPVGLVLTGWAYLWRITPLHRSEEPGFPERDGPPPLPDGTPRDDVQLPADGAGDYLRRRYRVEVCGADMDAAALMGRIREDINQVVPKGLARFKKENGDGPLSLGDQYTVRMPGPWDGPVRVVDATPTSFRFVTLEGHLEAGQIQWSAEDRGDHVRFEVQSWSRPGDALSNFAHHYVRGAKEVQLHMWTSVLEKVTRLLGGRMRSGIEIRTWVVDGDEVAGDVADAEVPDSLPS